MIVALHGFTGSPQMWKCIGLSGPSLLGHSLDCPARGDESFADEVRRLAAILPTAPVHVVGYSLGARLGLAIALAAPDRVRALTLIGGNPGIEDEEARRERVIGDERWCRILEEDGIEAFVDEWQALPLWQSQRRLPGPALEALRSQRLAHDPRQLARAMRALGTGVMPPMWNALQTLRLPVQVIVGELDTKYQELGRRMHRQLPDATFHSIAGAGHNPVLERPQSVLTVIKELP